MKILIIDNDVNTAETIKAAITSRTAYKVVVEYSGTDGLNRLKDGSVYELVILDLMMPDINGIDVCKEMMQSNNLKYTPVLIASALPVASQAFQESLENFEELSVIKDVLEKPFAIDTLINKVNTILYKDK